MCGINGFNFKDESLIKKMNEATKHRGPDGAGIYLDDNISLGHNLLAITEDPENSRQPIQSSDGNYVLIYNGEIYNYVQLRNKLKNVGDDFRTNSDTEVLFRGLVRYGVDFLSELDGMFALAFYDKRAGTILLARDGGGMKPLYFYNQSGKLVFSSEMRGIFTHDIDRLLNHKVVGIFFTLGYVPGPETLIKNIQKLNPGQYIVFNTRGEKLRSGWFYSRNEQINQDFDPDKLRNIIGRSVRNHTMGLRPFGLFLSGGLDSTVVLYELARINKGLIKTYTTRFDSSNPKYNEDADFAKKLCSEYNIEHHELLVTESDFINAVESVIETIEEPRYNHSTPAYWLLMRYASRDVTIILNGSGGDEIFLGYPRYISAANVASRYKKWPAWALNFLYSLKAFKTGQLKFGHFLHLDNLLTRWVYIHKIDTFIRDRRFNLPFNVDLSELTMYLSHIGHPAITRPLSDSVNAVAEYDKLFWLADEEFLRTDKIAMHFGMEGRFPFMARDIMNFAYGLPSDVKIKPELKNIIRRSYKGYLPDFIINKGKTGWNAPVAEWMDSKFGIMVKDVLSNDYYPETSRLFNFNFIRKNFIDGVNKHSLKSIKKFLPIFYFQIWARKFKVNI